MRPGLGNRSAEGHLAQEDLGKIQVNSVVGVSRLEQGRTL